MAHVWTGDRPVHNIVQANLANDVAVNWMKNSLRSLQLMYERAMKKGMPILGYACGQGRYYLLRDCIEYVLAHTRFWSYWMTHASPSALHIVLPCRSSRRMALHSRERSVSTNVFLPSEYFLAHETHHLYQFSSRLEAAVKQASGRTQEFEYQLRAVEVRYLVLCLYAKWSWSLCHSLKSLPHWAIFERLTAWCKKLIQELRYIHPRMS